MKGCQPDLEWTLEAHTGDIGSGGGNLQSGLRSRPISYTLGKVSSSRHLACLGRRSSVRIRRLSTYAGSSNKGLGVFLFAEGIHHLTELIARLIFLEPRSSNL